MQKQAYSRFSPLPSQATDALYFDLKAVKLPYSDSFSKLHYHNRYEIGICEAGEGMFLSQGIVSYLSQGDVIFVAPNVHHYSRSLVQDTPCRCRFAFLEEKAIENLLVSLCDDRQTAENILETARKGIPSVLRVAEMPREHAQLTQLMETCSPNRANVTALAKLRLALFLLDTYCTWKERKESAQDFQTDALITSVSEYIATNYDRNDSVSDLARLCHLSESQFRRRFLSAYGTPPMAYKNRLRCKIASEMLSRTQLSVAEISARVGYSDISDFYRAFKKSYGLSPSAYRISKPE